MGLVDGFMGFPSFFEKLSRLLHGRKNGWFLCLPCCLRKVETPFRRSGYRGVFSVII